MTEEVKKILNNFIKIVKKPTYTKETYDGNLATLFKTYTLETSEVETLLNYITNLQKENEELKEENKRIFSRVNDDELLISNAMNYAELQDYKSRNEKAIEWCECVLNAKYTADKLPNGKTTDMGYCLDLAEPLLNILKGENDD